MPTFHVETVQYGTGTGEQIDRSVNVDIVDGASTQLWMITGSGKFVYPGMANGLIEATVTVAQGGGQPETKGTLRAYSNHAPNHCTFPPLFFTTTLPAGQATVRVHGVSSSSQWDGNDTLQVAVVEMDHTGLGGGA